jgi:hypothetical protein
LTGPVLSLGRVGTVLGAATEGSAAVMDKGSADVCGLVSVVKPEEHIADESAEDKSSLSLTKVPVEPVAEGTLVDEIFSCYN